MTDEILEKIKSNNKERKKIKVRMAIFKYIEITTLISGGIYLLENIIKNSVYGLLNSIIVTTISSIPYGLMAYGARYLYKKNRVKRISLEEINKACNEKLNLELNQKTQIGIAYNGIDFLGFNHILTGSDKVLGNLDFLLNKE